MIYENSSITKQISIKATLKKCIHVAVILLNNSHCLQEKEITPLCQNNDLHFAWTYNDSYLTIILIYCQTIFKPMNNYNETNIQSCENC